MSKHHPCDVLKHDGRVSGIAKPCRWLPRSERWYVVEIGHKWFSIHWRPYKGLWWASVRPKGDRTAANIKTFPLPMERAMKRRSVALDGLPVIPAIGMASVLLAKLPLIREFLTATTYDDGTPRTPGYLWLTNKGSVLELLLFDPDGCARLPVTGATFDDVLMGAEKLLGVPEAPWQVDSWLQEKQAKRRKKK